MTSIHHLGQMDYIIIAVSLLVSLGIGVWIHFTGSKQSTSTDFFLAGKNMSKLPVIFSIVVTYLSAILMLGAPAEIYKYGSQIMVLIIGMVVGIIIATYLFLPIFFNLGIRTVYEYLEMRYGRFTRIAVSGLFILQTMMFMSVVLYAPSLALSAVTNLTTETSVIFMGIVCILYCALGGLQAVLWTDTFQCGLMYACLITVLTVGILEVGSVSEVVRKAQEGQRLQFFNIEADLTTQYTIWNTFFRGVSMGVGGFGLSQLEIQRLLSINDVSSAQSAILWSIGPMLAIMFMCHSMGPILYGVFCLCDPILNGEVTGLTKYDQLLPYFIVTRMSHIPGLTGLCIAGLFSGSLSTISSAVNSMSTVTVVDFIQPYMPFLTDKQIVWTAKALVILYGGLCIGFTFLFSHIGSLTQMALVALGVVEGPIIAIFLLGILTERTNEMGSALGFLAGCFLSGWIGYGTTLSNYAYPTLPLSVENCSGMANITDPLLVKETSILTNLTSNEMKQQSNIFFLYRVSFMWIPTIGFIFSVCTSYLASFMTCLSKEKKIDAILLSPFVKKWMNNPAFEDSEEGMEVRNVITCPDAEATQSIKHKTISDCTL